MSELKPCPFCGGENISQCDGGGDSKYLDYFMECDDCGARASYDTNRWREDALSTNIKKWNNRPIENALTAENEALKAKVAELEADIKKIEERADYVYNQNARMREALQRIVNADTSRDVYEYAATTPRMLSYCIEIAEQTLKGGEA